MTCGDEVFGKRTVVLIWDGLSAHRSKDVKAWLATQQHWLHVGALPGYAHDLNPMELVWGSLKATELANLCPTSSTRRHRRTHRPAAHRQQLPTVLQLPRPTGLRL
ncbi:transposase [Dactylosporangium darangshiense]|uniref:Tc1-like transposase DDE domain-containing protein n=1 Tax=Dactylosporangium darangshiense TaxID=579108 RepID=A0ABP8DWC9_9ACTN